MRCEDIYPLLSAKLDDELRESEEAMLKAHLEECEDCRKLYRTMFSIEEQTAGLRVSAPDGFKQGVLYRIGQEARGGKKKRRFFGAGTGIGVVAAALVLLVGAGVITLPRHSIRSKNTAAPAQEAATQEKPQCSNNAAFVPSSSAAPEETEFAVDWKAILEDSKVAVNSDATAWPSKNEDPPESPVKHGGTFPSFSVTEPTFPAGEAYYYCTQSGETNSLPIEADTPLPDACMQLCTQAEAPVLLYTEFSDASLLRLLEQSEPELSERLKEIRPMTWNQAFGLEDIPDPKEETESEPLLPPVNLLPDEPKSPLTAEQQMILYPMDYQTALAVHEWLLQNLPRPQNLDADSEAAENSILTRMEEIDPDSGALHSIITFAPRTEPVEWPEDWPEDWDLRLRTGENWALFYPDEQFVPAKDDLAFLVFLIPQTEGAETR